MPDQTIVEQWRAQVAAALATARASSTYAPMFASLDRLNASGWDLIPFAADTGIYVGRSGRPDYGPHLCVSGADNFGDRLTGVIDARGDFYGEPLD